MLEVTGAVQRVATSGNLHNDWLLSNQFPKWFKMKSFIRNFFFENSSLFGVNRNQQAATGLRIGEHGTLRI